MSNRIFQQAMGHRVGTREEQQVSPGITPLGRPFGRPLQLVAVDAGEDNSVQACFFPETRLQLESGAAGIGRLLGELEVKWTKLTECPLLFLLSSLRGLHRRRPHLPMIRTTDQHDRQLKSTSAVERTRRVGCWRPARL